MRTFLERYCKEVLQIDSAEELAEMIYSYWKNRREELKFPLLRLLWKHSPGTAGLGSKRSSPNINQITYT